MLAVPDLAGALSDAARSLGGWIYVAVAVLVFLETTALLGFVIHGELALMLGGVAAECGDASLLAMIALVCAAAVAGDLVSLLLGRRLGRRSSNVMAPVWGSARPGSRAWMPSSNATAARPCSRTLHGFPPRHDAVRGRQPGRRAAPAAALPHSPAVSADS